MLRILLSLMIVANAHAWDHVYAKFDALLHVHVRDGLVDYAALKDRPDELVDVQSDFELLTRAEYDSFAMTQKLAFWINAYNLYTLRLIVDNYPLASVRDLSRPWEREFFALLGTMMSLDHVMNGILRKDFKEPRIHYALVNGTKGGPALQDWAYTAENLDSQLGQAGKAFLADASRNRIEPENGRIYVSSVFKMYGRDFEHDGMTFLDDIVRLTGVVYAERPKTEYLEYDWTLNALPAGE